MTEFAVFVLSFTDVATMVTGRDEVTGVGAVKVTLVPLAALKVPQEAVAQDRLNVTPELLESFVTVAFTVAVCP
jgi:hypothetical protein